MASITKAKKIVEAGLKSGITPFIWGSHGNGKSQLVKQVADRLGIGFMDIRCALAEAGDFQGIPFVDSNNKMKFAESPLLPPMEWSTSKNLKQQFGILFLDEINRARQDTLQCVFQLILEKKIGEHYKMPEGWAIVAAGNPNGEDYTVTDLDPALLGRFCHIQLTPTADEWLDHARDVKFRDDVRQFVMDNKKMLGNSTKGVTLEHVQPTPRGWEMLARMTDSLEALNFADECLLDVATGIVGGVAATEYVNYRKTKFKRISTDDILNHYTKIRKFVQQLKEEGNQSLQKEAIDELLTGTKPLDVKSILKDEKKLENVTTFLTDISADIGYIAAEILTQRDDYRPLLDEIIKRNDGPYQKFFELLTSLEQTDQTKRSNKNKEAKEAKEKKA